MNEYKKNRIPIVSTERLNSSIDTSIGVTKEERLAYAFVKGKEATQPFTIRIPIDVHKKLRKIAFDQNEKINQIVVNLIKEYINSK